MSWRRSPLPRDWTRRRRRVLERDRYRCQLKGPECVRQANEVDHIGLDDDHRMVNLRSACGPCHHTRSAAQARAAQISHLRPEVRHPGLIPEPHIPSRRKLPDPYGVSNGRPGLVTPSREGVTPQGRG